MNIKEVEETYGKVIFENGKIAVRIKSSKILTEAFIHRVEEGKELLPRGYLMGSNYLKIEHK